MATEFLDVVLDKATKNLVPLTLMALPLVLFLLLPKRAPWARARFRWVERGVAAGLAVLLFGVAFLGISVGDKGHASPYDMYHRNNEPVASVNQLGLLITMRLDLQRTALGFEPGWRCPRWCLPRSLLRIRPGKLPPRRFPVTRRSHRVGRPGRRGRSR